MNLDFISSATAKELQQFKSVCNQLLSRTFVVRTLYRPGRERLNNPDYIFLSIHFEAVRDYLSLLDWDLRHDEANGCFYVINTDEANRLILSKRETAILLALRMLYDESQERLGLEQDALCTVREVLEKVVTDYAILPAMLVFENHVVIQRIEGRYNQADCRFAILPTILTAVSAERLHEAAAVLRKEENADEEAEENTAD